jgi:hypothetical protein
MADREHTTALRDHRGERMSHRMREQRLAIVESKSVGSVHTHPRKAIPEFD